MKPRVHYMPRIYLYIYMYTSSPGLELNATRGVQIPSPRQRCRDTAVDTYKRRLLFRFLRVSRRVLTHRGEEREKAAQRGERQGLRVTNWHYPLRTGRHRARCARGISREVSPSASSIPDAIVRVKV